MFTSRLLRRQRHARGLRVEAHQQAALVARAEAVTQLAGPDPPGRAVLRDLLEEVEVCVEEEGEPRRERIDVEPALECPFHVRETVGERERELLGRRRPGLPDVVPRDRDRVPERHLRRAELHHVGDQPHRWSGREDVLLLRDVLLEDVRLDRSAEAVARHALLLAHDEVVRKQDGGRRVDRHRRRHLAERDSGEQDLHVLERADGDALPTDFTERPWMVGVVPHQRRHVEGGRQPGLPVVEQVAEPLVRLLGRAEAGELAHRPQPPPVHRRIHTPRERERARDAEVPRLVRLDALRGVQGLDVDA